MVKDMAITYEFPFFDNALTIAIVAAHVVSFTIVQNLMGQYQKIKLIKKSELNRKPSIYLPNLHMKRPGCPHESAFISRLSTRESIVNA